MRKIKMFNGISADGYFACDDGNIDWHMVDDEFNTYALELMETFDTIIFGRVTYELFKEYWPKELENPKTSPDDRKIAQKINDDIKIVYSTTLKDPGWHGTELRKTVDADELKKLKASAGKDIMIYGSGTIVAELTNLGLIDEYHFMVMPVILGEGKSVFDGIDVSIKLALLDTRRFGNGNVLLSYEPHVMAE